MHKQHTRKYPQLSIGDKVKTYMKKHTGDKESKPKWSDDRYEVENITYSHGQPFFKLVGVDRQYLRNELLQL